MFIWQKKLRYRLGISGKQKKYRRNYYRGPSKLTKTIIFFLIIFLVSTYIFSSVSKRISPLIYDFSLSKLNSSVVKECNTAVGEIIASNDVGYETLVNRSVDKNDNIKSLSVNYREYNILKSELANDIQTRIDKINSVTVEIPVLAMFTDRFYSAFGIPINIKVLTNESVKVEFVDDFISVGINQTKHLVSVRVTVAVAVNLPVKGNGEDIITDIPIAESIIMGDVPSTYLDFK